MCHIKHHLPALVKKLLNSHCLHHITLMIKLAPFIAIVVQTTDVYHTLLLFPWIAHAAVNTILTGVTAWSQLTRGKKPLPLLVKYIESR